MYDLKSCRLIRFCSSFFLLRLLSNNVLSVLYDTEFLKSLMGCLTYIDLAASRYYYLLRILNTPSRLEHFFLAYRKSPQKKNPPADHEKVHIEYFSRRNIVHNVHTLLWLIQNQEINVISTEKKIAIHFFNKFMRSLRLLVIKAERTEITIFSSHVYHWTSHIHINMIWVTHIKMIVVCDILLLFFFFVPFH